MRIKFLKQWFGSYGIFPAGRECELAGPMLAACPRDVYEEVKEEPDAKQADTPANKQQVTPKNKQVTNSANKTRKVEKGMETDGKKAKIQHKK